MPLPVALIAAGAQLAGQGINAVSTGAMNRKTRKWNEKMYGIQRQDALADWHMQNAYNTPGAQMQRLKDAGLNPNLVYGNGAQAGSVSSVRSTDIKGWQPNPIQVDPGSAVSAYLDVKSQELNQDKLVKQNALLDQEQALKEARAAEIYANILLKGSQKDLTDTNTQLKGVDLQYASKTKAYALEALEASIKKTLQDTELSKANTQYRLAENERAQLRNGMTLEEAATRILKMRADILNNQARTDYQRELARYQIAEIQERIKKIQADAKGSDEKARLLKSTPDWWTQHGVGTVESLVKDVGKNIMTPKALRLKPHQSVVDRRTGEILPTKRIK